MQIQLTPKRILNAFLVGTMTLTIGAVHVQPAAAQLDRSTFRETAKEIGLSRSQMRSVAGIMRGFQSDIQDILTPDQLEQMKSAREQQQSPQQLRAELDLTDTQSTQLTAVRKDMVTDLRGVLEPDQVEKILEMVAF